MLRIPAASLVQWRLPCSKGAVVIMPMTEIFLNNKIESRYKNGEAQRWPHAMDKNGGTNLQCSKSKPDNANTLVLILPKVLAYSKRVGFECTIA